MVRVLGALVAPRPLALVSTLDEQGRVNLAPFSMILPLSARPAVIGVAIQPRRDGAPKATLANARRTGELVLNAVTLELLPLALECGAGGRGHGPRGETLAPSISVAPPRLLASPAQLECRVSEVLTPAGTAASLVVARVEELHFDQQLLDASGGPMRGLVGHLGMVGPGEHLFWTGTGLVRGWVADGQAARFEHVASSFDN